MFLKKREEVLKFKKGLFLVGFGSYSYIISLLLRDLREGFFLETSFVAPMTFR
jgi:hypothetical protein